MPIVNFGSLNIDHVYRLPTIVRPGETLLATDYKVFAGGKGLNQSVALARAGAVVFHAGCMGPEGGFLVQTLKDAGVDTRHVRTVDVANGHAMIQVDDQGQNAIALFAGSNRSITLAQIDQVLSQFGNGDILLLQNEINFIPELILRAKARGIAVAFNAAPMGPEVNSYPLDQLDWLIVNETEAAAILGRPESPAATLDSLAARWPSTRIALTLGADGVICRVGSDKVRIPAQKVHAIDTTAAGDTFLGYLLVGASEGMELRAALVLANRAAAICVTREGASTSIPWRRELL